MAYKRKTASQADIDHLFFATDDEKYKATKPKRWNALQRKKTRIEAKKNKSSGSSGG